ncbi:hypothetical protein TUMSATVNIG1_40000 [Vibrio nigripulchritudo]|uniref:hypothetical protein n=1 Tax=Vibrio nigripulchritudo TaxID=28173 RepID=UPI001909F51C|nr:hypothetical protein [Vibrio nigripulchritudo]BCL72033.1 hypothetical protein VNTUMSATTG_39700 [Vibrio nigripulchritudo]BDU33391.1 hypothetical protein TUMSATVNIG1_40000 [Vibrio nigripulchritudo]
MNISSKQQKQIAYGLLALRVTVALVFFIWAMDKILVPEHSTKVFAKFYGLDVSAGFSLIIGLVQLVFVAALALGIQKSTTYLLALILHGFSTFSSFMKYLDPFNNLLFFTAWPMFAACLALYLMRDLDTITLGGKSQEEA